MTLTFIIHIGSYDHLVNCIYQFWQKHRGPNLTLLWNRSRSTQGHHLNKLGSTRAPNVAYQVSRSSAFWFWRRRFFKVFTIYGHGGHLGHVTWTVWFSSPLSYGGSIWNLTLIGTVVSEEKMFENVDIHTTHIHKHGQQRPTYPRSSPLRWAKDPFLKWHMIG